MILVADIGNSNIVLGLFDRGGDLCADAKYLWRLHTDALRTADEYISIVRSLFQDSGVVPSAIDFSFVSSVVPPLLPVFEQTLFALTGKKPLLFTPDMYHALPITVVEQARSQIGTDLLANAAAGFLHFGAACVVVDFGTALTFTIVDSNGVVQGVAIAPGLQTAVRSLFKNTAQLPSVLLAAPSSVLGTDTVSAIQSGVVLGYTDLVKGMLARIRAVPGYENAPAAATGGLAQAVENPRELFTHIDAQFTLKGLVSISCRMYNHCKK